jgi:hypothetical protein
MSREREGKKKKKRLKCACPARIFLDAREALDLWGKTASHALPFHPTVPPQIPLA